VVQDFVQRPNAVAMRVRPDGHVAWVGNSMSDPRLDLTIRAWTGV
jgi:hypothetical protein